MTAGPGTIVVRHEGRVCTLMLPRKDTIEVLIRNEFGIEETSALALTVVSERSEDTVVVPLDLDVLHELCDKKKQNEYALRVYPSSSVSVPQVEGQTGHLVTALFPYNAPVSTDLSFNVGDRIRVISVYNSEWLLGCLESQPHVQGYFPANHTDYGGEPAASHGDWQDNAYFETYNNMTIHLEMLRDETRTLAYKRAIFAIEDIKDKVVLDVGCGSGILSCFCAMAGAKHVYGVDASGIFHSAKKVVAANHLEDRVTLLNGKLEELQLPVDHVDVIVSEWMGTMLICESMFSSVLYARDRYLAPDGLLLPCDSTIYLVPMMTSKEVGQRIDFWKDVYGVDMSCLQEPARREFYSSAVFDKIIQPEEILAKEQEVLTLDMATANDDGLDCTCTPFSFIMERDGTLHGFGTWFDSRFRTSASAPAPASTLSTSPYTPLTHWRHVTFTLSRHMDVLQGDVVSGEFEVRRNEQWLRHFEVELRLLFPNGQRHEQVFPLWQ